MTKDEYKSAYLKVTSRDATHSVKDLGKILKDYADTVRQIHSSEIRDPRLFGCFYEIFRKKDWVVLRLDPYSADMGIPKKSTNYETCDQAVNAAINFLSESGYQAKPFDLEGKVDKI